MLQRLCRLALGVVLVAAFGCKKDSNPGDGKGQDGSASAAQDVDRGLLSAVASLGEAAPLVVVVRPEAWPALQKRLGLLLTGQDGELAAIIRASPNAADLPKVVAAVLDLPQDAPDMSGWDPTRPIVAGLAEPPSSGPVLAPVFAIDQAADHTPGIRHQVLIPATDPSQLVRSLATMTAKAGVDAAGLVRDRPGAVARRVDEDTFVAYLPEQDAVRIVILQGESVTNPDAPPPPVGARLSVAAKQPALTPALRAITNDPAQAVGVLVRPWRLRALSSWNGTISTLRAVATISRERRLPVLANGLSTVVGAEVLMADSGVEFDDWSASVVLEDQALRVRQVASLTPRGRDVFDAGQNTVAPLPLMGDVAAHAFVGLSLPKMLAAAEVHPVVQAGLEGNELVRAARECGPLCLLHAGARAPVQTIKSALKAVGPTPFGEPTLVGLQAVWLRSKPGTPRAAFAAIAQSETDAQAMKKAVDTVAPATSAAITTQLEKRGAQYVVLVGLGADPKQVFRMEEVPRGPLGSLSIDVGRAVDTLGLDTKVRAAAHHIDLAVERRGPALVAHWVVAFHASAKPITAPTFDGMVWESPIRSSPAREVDRCLADLALALRSGLTIGYAVAPDQALRASNKMLAKIEPQLECVAKDPSTAPIAARARFQLVEPVVDRLVRGLRTQAALELADAQCTASGDENICALKADLVDAPQIELARAQRPERCRPDSEGVAFQVVVSGGGAWVDNKRVDPDPAKIADTLRRAANTQDTEGEFPQSVGLAVDARTGFADVAPVLAGLTSARVQRVLVQMRGADGAVTGVWVRLPAAAIAIDRDGSDGAIRTHRIDVRGASVSVVADRGRKKKLEAPDPAEVWTAMQLKDGSTPGASVSVEPTTAWTELVPVLLGACPSVSVAP